MTIYDPSLSDDEWREANFDEPVLRSAQRLGHIESATKLIEYAKKYGPEGISESAIMLGQDGYKRVEEALKKLPSPGNGKYRRRRS